MKRIKLPRIISLNTIMVYMGLFCVSTFALLEHVTISISAFSPIKLYLMYIGFFCVLTQIKTISRCLLKRKYFYILLTVFVFCLFLGLSMLGNRGSAFGMPLYRTVRFVLFLVELFALVIVFAETGRVRGALKFLFWYTLLIVLVNDVLMFSRVITFGTTRYENYVVGTKFSVAYLHMDLLTLWLMVYGRKVSKHKGRKWAVLLATVFITLVTIRTNCMTGLLGCLMLAVLFEVLQTKNGSRLCVLASPGVLMLAFLLSVVFIFTIEAIADIPAVRFIVEEVLKRDTSITGRTNIYQVLIENLEGHWLQGYGYGNDNEVSVQLFGYANVQNGLMQWVLQIGIPATVTMVAIYIQVFKQLSRSRTENRLRAMPMVILVYSYIVLATVETTFNMTFIMWFALICMLVTERKETASGQGSARIA